MQHLWTVEDEGPLLQGMFHQAILGDLNTMAHGLARLSPQYCCDKMRFWTLGRPEAHFWHHNLISVTDPRYLPGRDGQPAGVLVSEIAVQLHSVQLRGVFSREFARILSVMFKAEERLCAWVLLADEQEKGQGGEAPVNAKLLWWGVREDVCRDALNPGMPGSQWLLLALLVSLQIPSSEYHPTSYSGLACWQTDMKLRIFLNVRPASVQVSAIPLTLFSPLRWTTQISGSLGTGW